jgi:hypothetical protein
MHRVVKLVVCGLFSCCSGPHTAWQEVTRISTVADHVTYTFPASISEGHRSHTINDCKQAISHSLSLIQKETLTDSIDIEFFATRREMQKFSGLASSGMAFPETRTMFCLIGQDIKPPIQHELMHMVAMLAWGKPPTTSTWMNEGLATFSENKCNGYSVVQIYRFLEANHYLISMDSLSQDFYHQSEMIAYHQAAFVVEFLLAHYGLSKFNDLWTKGWFAFNSIYGFSTQQLLFEASHEAFVRCKEIPTIDWDSFQRGCN